MDAKQGDAGGGLMISSPDSAARELLRMLAAIRGAAKILVQRPELLSAEQHADMLSILNEQSAQAIELLRRAMTESCAEHGHRGDALARLVRSSGRASET
jgi:hypothetical protein